jgi:hypothetical protein
VSFFCIGCCHFNAVSKWYILLEMANGIRINFREEMYIISLKIKSVLYLKSMLGDLAFCPPIILVDSDKGVPATEEDFECRHCIRIRMEAELRRLLWSFCIGVYNLNSFDLGLT